MTIQRQRLNCIALILAGIAAIVLWEAGIIYFFVHGPRWAMHVQGLLTLALYYRYRGTFREYVSALSDSVTKHHVKG